MTQFIIFSQSFYLLQFKTSIVKELGPFNVDPFPQRLETYFILFLYFYNEFINK